MEDYRTVLRCDKCGSRQIHLVKKRTRISFCEKCKSTTRGEKTYDQQPSKREAWRA